MGINNRNRSKEEYFDGYPNAKVPLSCRIDALIKDILKYRGIELGFKNFSQYIEYILEKEVNEGNMSRLSQYDLEQIKEFVGTEIKKNNKPIPIVDKDLENLLKKTKEKILPEASNTFFNNYSTENITKEDLKRCLYEFLEQCIENEDYDLITVIREKLK